MNILPQAATPGDLAFESIGEKEAREAVDAAEKIEAFVLEKIGPLPDTGDGPQASSDA